MAVIVSGNRQYHANEKIPLIEISSQVSCVCCAFLNTFVFIFILKNPENEPAVNFKNEKVLGGIQF